MYTYIIIYLYKYMYTYVCVYIYRFICTYIYLHIYIHLIALIIVGGREVWIEGGVRMREKIAGRSESGRETSADKSTPFHSPDVNARYIYICIYIYIYIYIHD